MNATRNVLIVSPDVVGENMAGPGVRYYELARVLAAHFSVTLAAPPSETAHSLPGFSQFPVLHYRDHTPESWQPLIQAASKADVVLVQGLVLEVLPFLKKTPGALVVDLYDPFLFENLSLLAQRPAPSRSLLHRAALSVLLEQLRYGDFFICASERQRDFWIGMLTALDRINPALYEVDPSARRLIDVVPFGLPSEPPQHCKQVLKGVVPGIAAEDLVLLWGGGLWQWLAPLPLIQAVAKLAPTHPRLKLFFAGIKRPNSAIKESPVVHQCVQLAKDLGVIDRHVFFNEWIPYGERENFLIEADLGVVLDQDHVESHFAFRTRLLDHIWARLPSLITAGSPLADLVEKHGLGRVVANASVEELSRALEELAQVPNLRQSYEDRFASVASAFRWDRVAEPLLRFCEQPYKISEARVLLLAGRDSGAARPAPTVVQLVGAAWHSLLTGGPLGLVRDVRSYLRWKSGGGRV